MDWTKIRSWIIPTSSVGQSASIPAGMWHYSRQRDHSFVRFHLRVDHSGQALLIAAASEAVHLTRSGAIAARGILEGKSEAEITVELNQMAAAPEIICQIRSLMDHLGSPNKRYPIFNLPDSASEYQSSGLIAPFQADIELPENSQLLTGRLRALWQAGIPHVRVLLPSEDSQANLASSRVRLLEEEQLSRLCTAIQIAEDIGMIAGVRLTVSQLLQSLQGDKLVVDELAQMGLDYAVVPWGVDSRLHDELFGEGDFDRWSRLVSRAEHWEFPIVAQAGLVPSLIDQFEDQMDRLIEGGITHFETFPIAELPQLVKSPAMADQRSDMPPRQGAWADYRLSAPDDKWLPFQAVQMRQLAGWIEDLADNRRVQIVWLAPHSCSAELDPNLVRQLIYNGPRAGADISLRVDAHGRVFPPRGPRESVGQIDNSTWSQIWNHRAFRHFRDAVDQNQHCDICPRMAICAAGCPSEPTGWTIEDA